MVNRFMMLILLACAAPAAAQWCSSFAPLAGGEMPALGISQCLSQSTVDGWNADPTSESFYKEPLILPASLSNLEYNGQQMPLKIATWASFLSGGAMSAVITDILAGEVLGLNTSLVCTWGGPHAIRMVGGCSNPMDYTETCRANGQPVQDPPLAHAHVEAWVNTAQEITDASGLRLTATATLTD